MKIEEVKNKSIIIDSCILLYCSIYNFKIEVRKVLRTLTDNGNQLMIAEVCGFEVLKNVEVKDIEYVLKLLDYLPNVRNDAECLINSVMLHRAYKNSKIDFKENSPIDFIIGGVTMGVEDSLLMTANKRHFPSPFWKTAAKTYQVYEEKEQYQLVSFYLMEPMRKVIVEKSKIFN